MQSVELIRALFALAVTLGLFGLAVVGMRRYGPGVFRRMNTVKGPRRLEVVESLLLDPQRRLVLVSLDGREQLILLGEGRQLDGAPPSRGTA